MKHYVIDSLAVGLLCSPTLILICTAPLWAYIASIGYLCVLILLARKYRGKIKEHFKYLSE